MLSHILALQAPIPTNQPLACECNPLLHPKILQHHHASKGHSVCRVLKRSPKAIGQNKDSALYDRAYLQTGENALLLYFGLINVLPLAQVEVKTGASFSCSEVHARCFIPDPHHFLRIQAYLHIVDVEHRDQGSQRRIYHANIDSGNSIECGAELLFIHFGLQDAVRDVRKRRFIHDCSDLVVSSSAQLTSCSEGSQRSRSIKLASVIDAVQAERLDLARND